MDGKHSKRLQNINVYVWTGPQNTSILGLLGFTLSSPVLSLVGRRLVLSNKILLYLSVIYCY